MSIRNTNIYKASIHTEGQAMHLTLTCLKYCWHILLNTPKILHANLQYILPHHKYDFYILWVYNDLFDMQK